MANYTIPYAAQLACRYPNTTIPEPPFITSSSVSSCAVSNYNPAAGIALSRCCDTTGDDAIKADRHVAHVQTKLFHPVEIGGYLKDGCAWEYCNVTSQSGVGIFEKCIQTTKDSLGMEVSGKCFIGKEAKAQQAVTSDGTKIKWRSDKKKDTVSAALLMALGVAGIIIGGA